jgi:hypothetical protein
MKQRMQNSYGKRISDPLGPESCADTARDSVKRRRDRPYRDRQQSGKSRSKELSGHEACHDVSVLDQTGRTRVGSINFYSPSHARRNYEPVISCRQRFSLGVKTMTYVMTKPCPICKKQLTKQHPTETVTCSCGNHVWQG